MFSGFSIKYGAIGSLWASSGSRFFLSRGFKLSVHRKSNRYVFVSPLNFNDLFFSTYVVDLRKWRRDSIETNVSFSPALLLVEDLLLRTSVRRLENIETSFCFSFSDRVFFALWIVGIRRSPSSCGKLIVGAVTELFFFCSPTESFFAASPTETFFVCSSIACFRWSFLLGSSSFLGAGFRTRFTFPRFSTKRKFISTRIFLHLLESAELDDVEEKQRKTCFRLFLGSSCFFIERKSISDTLDVRKSTDHLRIHQCSAASGATFHRRNKTDLRLYLLLLISSEICYQ